MASLRKYLKQSVTLRRLLSEDDYTGTTYSDPETIKARKTEADGRTVNSLGAEVENRTKVLTDVEVGVGDLIDEARVEGVEAIVDKRGKTIGWRVEL